MQRPNLAAMDDFIATTMLGYHSQDEAALGFATKRNSMPNYTQDENGNVTFQIKITKAKANLEVKFSELPPEIQMAVVEKGLSAFLNGATTKVTAATDPDEATRSANAMALAEKKLDSLKAGKLVTRTSKSDGKVPGVVMTEARRLAKNVIKAGIKAAGERVSDYTASAITEAANAYLEEHPELVTQAQANLEAVNKIGGNADALKSLVAQTGIKKDPAKVAANEKKKAEAKAATAAKNAGKPGPQKSAVASRMPPKRPTPEARTNA